MDTTKPVIIVGAPRSGTSLMQKLIRETEGFVSVPKESDMIWLPYCHPARNDWQSEACPSSRITDGALEDIRTAFANQALSARTWRLFSLLAFMERPLLASLLRSAYRTMFRPWKRLREQATTRKALPGRIVDKSVHAGLWLNLVDSVFPDALYLHMVRSPATCIPSMMHGWRDHQRFRTYRIPESIASPREDTLGWWCFPLPAGWLKYYNKEILDICCFQWNAINNSILEYLARETFQDRVMRVHLEHLSRDPHTVLGCVQEFICTADDLAGGKKDLKKVNPSDNPDRLGGDLLRWVIERTESTYLRTQE